MTGFRIAKGCAQEHWGITPDLTTMGKVIGGGLPVGAYGGRREIMEMVAPAGPMYQAGTLSGARQGKGGRGRMGGGDGAKRAWSRCAAAACSWSAAAGSVGPRPATPDRPRPCPPPAGNPLAMAAGIKTLEILGRPGAYEHLDKVTGKLINGIIAAAKENGHAITGGHIRCAAGQSWVLGVGGAQQPAARASWFGVMDRIGRRHGRTPARSRGLTNPPLPPLAPPQRHVWLLLLRRAHHLLRGRRRQGRHRQVCALPQVRRARARGLDGTALGLSSLCRAGGLRTPLAVAWRPVPCPGPGHMRR
jgi:hypothetical protein